MARPAQSRVLGVWMNGIRVGRWRLNPQGTHEFGYERSWIENSDARPISLSMPLVPADFSYTGRLVESYFDNLLPDSTEIRQRMRSRFGTRSLSAFDLLAQVGRDCVGAIQILHDDEEPTGIDRIDARELDSEGIETILKGVTQARGSGMRMLDDAFRISIAGAQEKTALLYHHGIWKVPLGSTPTTHILKLPLGRIGGLGIDMSGSVENEWLCSRLASALGIKTARCEIGRFGDTTVLVVERFDRRPVPDGSWILRLPQEDFCQVTGTAPSGKYETDGGPGIESIMRMLLSSQDARKDREDFLMAQIFFWLLAAPDGHAKNFSVFIERGGRFRLTPLYDIMSAYPVLGHGSGQVPPEKLKLAMAFLGKNRHYEWNRIHPRHIRETARRCGMEEAIDAVMAKLSEGLPRAVEELSASLPDTVPDAVASPIFSGLKERIKLLQAG